MNMKMSYRMIWMPVVVLAVVLMACGGGRRSAIEGKLVDGKDRPLAGVAVWASWAGQHQPIKGYEMVKTVTRGDGTFQLRGLYPSSVYQVATKASGLVVGRDVESAPAGETALMRTWVVRFMVSSEGVVTDTQYDLEWLTRPQEDTTYQEAAEWVGSSKVAGGGWRMPTRQELKAVWSPDIGPERFSWSGKLLRGGLHPWFRVNGLLVWAEVRSPSTAWYFTVADGGSGYGRFSHEHAAVLGVRQRSPRLE